MGEMDFFAFCFEFFHWLFVDWNTNCPKNSEVSPGNQPLTVKDPEFSGLEIVA